LQWGHTAVDAVGAWNKGQRGAGVRVAVLDSGIDADHPDLASKVNQALSVSFVPGENWNPLPGFYFNLGTHVAGTIAAADNGLGVIGVAPEAELIAVKVLSEFSGSGSFDWLITGIIYAADIDADVINMSLGAVLEKSGWVEPDGTRVLGRDVAELKNAILLM
jgi:subtilisin family serine protease